MITGKIYGPGAIEGIECAKIRDTVTDWCLVLALPAPDSIDREKHVFGQQVHVFEAKEAALPPSLEDAIALRHLIYVEE